MMEDDNDWSWLNTAGKVWQINQLFEKDKKDEGAAGCLRGRSTWLAVGYEPLQRNVDIVLLLAGDGIAADLSVLKY
jgi:hypothetical protein